MVCWYLKIYVIAHMKLLGDMIWLSGRAYVHTISQASVVPSFY